ncbi:vegetative storage protein 2-like [Olea europaea var. sylvestris]|uniref:vegetative storage protein 2-like n=1 Tax=Olea europaea var. sylvestris TaxID=158386 RepID=UPI000C1CEABE|nr:vegetative storage protein 2-like [Olea europaea var. sylvestris]
MRLAALLLFFATVFAISRVDGYIEQVTQQIHLLRPCWHLAVETNNVRNWKLVPEECEQYVGHYMLGKQYRKDFKIVANNTIEYAKSLTLVGDGKDIWIFDIDKTTLSNLPYYARSDAIWIQILNTHTRGTGQRSLQASRSEQGSKKDLFDLLPHPLSRSKPRISESKLKP